MFVWSTLLVTPLIMSTGMIGMTDYLGYFWQMSPWVTHGVAVGFTVLTVALLWRRIESVTAITKVLWGTMIVTVGLVIVGTYSHFDAHLAFHLPPGALSLGSFAAGLGAWSSRSTTSSGTSPWPTWAMRSSSRAGSCRRPSSCRSSASWASTWP